jgi:hypothetical protein
MKTHNHHPSAWLRAGLLTVAVAGAFAFASLGAERTASAQSVEVDVGPYPGVTYGWAPGYYYAPTYGYYGTRYGYGYGYPYAWRHHGYWPGWGYRGWQHGHDGWWGGHHGWGHGHHR